MSHSIIQTWIIKNSGKIKSENFGWPIMFSVHFEVAIFKQVKRHFSFNIQGNINANGCYYEMPLVLTSSQ